RQRGERGVDRTGRWCGAGDHGAQPMAAIGGRPRRSGCGQIEMCARTSPRSALVIESLSVVLQVDEASSWMGCGMDTAFVITNASVVTADGMSTADVAVDGGRISAVGRDLPIDSAARSVDGTGLLLCPGFIDLHAHSALRSFDDPLLAAKVGQGFTTDLVSPDGLGPAPVSDATLATRRSYLQGLEPSVAAPWSWRSMADYLTALAGSAPSLNLVSCVPHSGVREVVMGNDNRRADRRELDAMKDLVAGSLSAGARAVSFGMIYAPGLYADTDELTHIAE